MSLSTVALCPHSSFVIMAGENLIIIIKVFLPLKIASSPNYAVKPNRILFDYLQGRISEAHTRHIFSGA